MTTTTYSKVPADQLAEGTFVRFDDADFFNEVVRVTRLDDSIRVDLADGTTVYTRATTSAQTRS